MPQPKPSSSLDNSCSVIYDNTLYVYTPEAFQSIRLEEGAEWEELTYGESVTGATCIGQSQQPDNAGFWVIGGAGGATGMAKYTFSTGEWTYPTPRDDTLKNRQYHSSVYIKAIDEVLVYAGSRDGVAVPTMETFAIQLNEPYGVSGHTGATPNAIKPILLSWSDADALMVGGDPANTKVYLFNPNAGWRDFGANLAEPLTKDYTQMGAALMTGDDGSKSLFMLDMSASPNQVSRVVIQDASGAPVTNSPTITERGLVSRQDGGDWPSYNDTLAPTETRSNFGIAQGDDGMVVLTGGNDEVPMAMFNGMENKWLNATDELTFNLKANTVSSESSTVSSTSTSSSSTSSATSSTTTTSEASSSTISSVTSETTAAETSEAAAASDNSGDDGGDDGLGSNVILGITLGSIFAFLIILAALLFCLRRKKMQRNKAAAAAGGTRGPSREGPITDEKDPNMFGNAPPPGPPPASPGHFRGHYPQNSQESYSSMAILMGRMNQPKGLSRKGSNDSRTSMISAHRQFKSTISKPIPRDDSQPILGERGVTFDPAAPEPQPRSRNLVSDNQDGMRRSSGWNKYWSGGSSLQILGFGGKRNTSASDHSSSQYSQTSDRNPRVTQDSATVPPLNFEARTAMNRVNSGSPVVTGGASKLPFSEGMSGKIERPTSRGSSAGYSSGIPESVNDNWDPTDAGNTKSWGHDRAPSSVYGSGFNFGQPMRDGNKEPPSGVSSQPQLAMASKSSDMSWLNLGDRNTGQGQV